MRSLEILLASSLLALAAGCGDASDPTETNPAPAANVNDPAGSSTSTPAQGAPSSSDQPTGPQPTPVAPPTGNIYFRVANFLPNAADACVSGDAGKTWAGPIMHQLAGTSLATNSVSARLTVPNAHFTARMVSGSDCSQGIGTDVTVADIIGEWPATVVLGEMNNMPELRVLADEPSVSPSETYFRFVQAADWSTAADMGVTGQDCCGNPVYNAVFINTPYLGTAKVGTGAISAQGYAAIDPLQGEPVMFLNTTTQDVRATITATTDVNEKYSVFTLGTEAMTSVLICDDVASATADHLTPCSVFNDGDTFQDAASQGDGTGM